MTARLYLETNFLLGHAHGRDPATDRLIGTPLPGLEILIPTCCVMEALTNLGLERKRINGLLGGNQALANELGRNLASPHAARLADSLRAANREWELGLAWFEGRLLEAIRWCSEPSRVTCLPTTPASLAEIRPDLSRLDPTDQLILATILADTRGVASASKALVTENRRCFHDNKLVRQRLRAAGIQYFPHASKFLEWYDAEAEF